MQINHLRFFIALEQYKSISKASQMMNTAPQNLSRILKKIEDEFGVPLFARSANHITLTPNGMKFLEFAKNTVYQYDLLRSSITFSSKPLPEQTSITLFSEAIINDAYLQDILLDFFHQYPYIEVNNITNDYAVGYRKMTEIEDALGILIYDGGHTPDEALLEKKEILPIFKLHPVMIVNKHHPLAKKSIVSLHDLYHQELVIFAKESYAATETSMLLKKLQLDQNVSVRLFDNLKACYRAAATSTAICPGTLESFQKLEHARREGLVALPIANYPLIKYALIRPKNLPQDSVQALFCNYVLDYVQNNI